MINHDIAGLLGEVTDLMIRLEADHDSQGWDNNPPTIYRIARENNQLQPSRCRLGINGQHPRDHLQLLADMTQTSAYAMGERLTFPSSALAHLLIMESWVNDTFTSHTERHKDPRDLADIPGSREARFCLAIAGDQMVTLTRVRDDEPSLQVVEMSALSGGMCESLKEIHAASQRVGAW